MERHYNFQCPCCMHEDAAKYEAKEIPRNSGLYTMIPQGEEGVLGPYNVMLITPDWCPMRRDEHGLTYEFNL